MKRKEVLKKKEEVSEEPPSEQLENVDELFDGLSSME